MTTFRDEMREIERTSFNEGNEAKWATAKQVRSGVETVENRLGEVVRRAALLLERAETVEYPNPSSISHTVTYFRNTLETMLEDIRTAERAARDVETATEILKYFR